MARKRSRRGRRIVSTRKAAQWDVDVERIRRFEIGKRPRGQRILSARKAAQWDEERIRRFEEEQRRKREWISFAEIAEWFSELGGAGPNEASRELAYKMLEQDLLEGRFEEGGRPRVRFVFPGVSRTHGYMRPRWLQDAIDNDYDNNRGRSYLENCWLPRNLFERWCQWHHLPKSPPRFEPTDRGLQPAQATRQPQRERARCALKALFGSAVPNAATLPNKLLAKKVNEWLAKNGDPP
jgi:hypothetical protein